MLNTEQRNIAASRNNAGVEKIYWLQCNAMIKYQMKFTAPNFEKTFSLFVFSRVKKVSEADIRLCAHCAAFGKSSEK